MMEDPERPIQRPKDRETQKAHYSGKKKQHTLKNNLMVNADSKVVFLTASYEGRIHDKRIADRAGYSPPPGSVLYQDTGFQGYLTRVYLSRGQDHATDKETERSRLDA